MSENADIGERLRRTRRACDITQQALADRIGVAHSTIVRIEKGRIRPSADTLFALADALGVDPKWLLQGELPTGGLANMTATEQILAQSGPGTEGLPGFVVIPTKTKGE